MTHIADLTGLSCLFTRQRRRKKASHYHGPLLGRVHSQISRPTDRHQGSIDALPLFPAAPPQLRLQCSGDHRL